MTMGGLLTLAARILLSAIFTAGYFWVLYLFVSGQAKVAADLKEVLITILGVLTAGEMVVLNFWFSSSQGSALKTDVIARAPPVE